MIVELLDDQAHIIYMYLHRHSHIGIPSSTKDLANCKEEHSSKVTTTLCQRQFLRLPGGISQSWPTFTKLSLTTTTTLTAMHGAWCSIQPPHLPLGRLPCVIHQPRGHFTNFREQIGGWSVMVCVVVVGPRSPFPGE